MSRVIRSAEVICDDCGKSLQRLAQPHTKHTKIAERRALRGLVTFATRRGWQMEGPSLMAGDLCSRCRVYADLHHDLGAEAS